MRQELFPKAMFVPLSRSGRSHTEWYARHADADWTKWSVREAADMFKRHGLTGPIWTLSDESERF